MSKKNTFKPGVGKLDTNKKIGPKKIVNSAFQTRRSSMNDTNNKAVPTNTNQTTTK